MALALYRKYRPKTLGDLLGQETNVTILKNAAAEDRIGHAYLFYGPRGTGKTTTARLIAKLLNCETRKTDAKFRKEGEPCNACRACLAIDANTSFDVIEIDAASNRGIEEIRNLKENVRTAPAEGGYKVYIIDEAHMLTGPAFNALLKTLEEPPAHAVFVLATTEYEKLPATITSRVQRFLFRKLPKMKIVEKLAGIAKKEHISVDPAALELIAAAGEGSVRDAESLLEQVRSLTSSVDVKTVEELTGRTGFKKVEELAKLILENDLQGSLAHIAAVAEEGHNIVQFTKDLIHYIRKALTLAANPDAERYLHAELTEEEIARVKSLAKLVNTERCVPLLRALIRAYTEIRYSPFASVPLEIAIIEHLKS